MNKRTSIAGLPVKPPALLKTRHPEVFEERPHGRVIRRCEAHMGDILNFDDRHRFPIPIQF